jgi:D-lactate dehydrogenase
LTEANAASKHELTFFEVRLDLHTVALAAGHPAACVFVNDALSRPVLEKLKSGGTQLLALRSAGFNNVDLKAAVELGLTVARVPAYSPHAVAEHAVALILTLNRKIHRAYARVREANFSLHGLMGFDLNQRTVGVVGTGRIGEVFCQIMRGFQCRVLAYDPEPNAACEALGVQYVPLETLLAQADIVSLHARSTSKPGTWCASRPSR